MLIALMDPLQLQNCAYLEEEVDHLAQSIRALEENIDENHPVLYSELEKYSDTPKEALIQVTLCGLRTHEDTSFLVQVYLEARGIHTHTYIERECTGFLYMNNIEVCMMYECMYVCLYGYICVESHT